MDPFRYYKLISLPASDLTEDEQASVVYARAHLAQRYADASGGPQPTGRAANWCRMATRVLQVAERLGRLPHANDNMSNTLLYWVIRQRRSVARLNGFQIAFLELVPGWTWSPFDDEWDRHAEDLAAFLAREHRPPRTRSEDPHERSLARWASRQRLADSRNELPYARSLAFRQLFAPR